MTRLVLLLLLVASLGHCGYRLRTAPAVSVPAALTMALVTAAGQTSELAELLRDALADLGVEIVPADAEAPMVLRLSGETRAETAASLSAQGRAAQYTLRLAATVSLQRGAEVLLEPQEFAVERGFLEDVENVAGSREEMEILTAELRQELATAIMQRLTRVEVAP